MTATIANNKRISCGDRAINATDKGRNAVPRFWSILILSALILIMQATSGQGSDSADAGHGKVAMFGKPLTLSTCRPTVDALTNLTRNLKSFSHLRKNDAIKNGDEFEANSYFSVLGHLLMEPDYVLDWVYFFGGSGGEPVLYARNTKEHPYVTYSDFAKAKKAKSPFREQKRYLERVRIDGTPEGYFQYTLLYLMGGRFYLYWHANYNDHNVICDRSEAEAILANLKPSPSESAVGKGLQKVTSPQVEMKGDVAIVKVVVFTKWGGFIQKTFDITMSFPHTIGENSEVLIPYQCGMFF